MKRPALYAALIYAALCVGQAHATTVDDLLDAIRRVETGGEPNGGRDATGDQGRSIGPLQIQRACWIDSGIPGHWEDCRDYAYARRVAKAYWQRYCPSALKAGDYETLARVWNGGPKGHTKKATLAYWAKVHQALNQKGLSQ